MCSAPSWSIKLSGQANLELVFDNVTHEMMSAQDTVRLKLFLLSPHK